MGKKLQSRRLVVILHADIVGSTMLVQLDEAIAHNRFQIVFSDFSKIIKAYGGVAHEIRGDALVAEFELTTDAVNASLAFQAKNLKANKTIKDDIKPQLRIGISLGEVIIADKTITGSGVVMAQRLEQLADPGGIVVHSSISDTVPKRMPYWFETLGEQVLKGFDEPVRCFAVTLRQGEAIPKPEIKVSSKTDKPVISRTSKIAMSVLGIMMLTLIGIGTLILLDKPPGMETVDYLTEKTEQTYNRLKVRFEWIPVLFHKEGSGTKVGQQQITDEKLSIVEVDGKAENERVAREKLISGGSEQETEAKRAAEQALVLAQLELEAKQRAIEKEKQLRAARERKAEAERIAQQKKIEADKERQRQEQLSRQQAEAKKQAELKRKETEKKRQAELKRKEAEEKKLAELERIAAEEKRQADLKRIAAEEKRQAELKRIAAEEKKLAISDLESSNVLLVPATQLIGRYSSEISFLGSSNPQWSFGGSPKIEVKLGVAGDKISGTFSGTRSGTIAGRLDGDEVKFEWLVTDGTAGVQEGRGKWKITNDPLHLEGKWTGPYESYGKWNLTRLFDGSISGKWIDDELHIVASIKQNGNKLTGWIGYVDGELKGTRVGNVVTLKFKYAGVTYNYRKGKAKLQISSDGNKLIGARSGGGLPKVSNWILTRKPD